MLQNILQTFLNSNVPVFVTNVYQILPDDSEHFDNNMLPLS